MAAPWRLLAHAAAWQRRNAACSAARHLQAALPGAAQAHAAHGRPSAGSAPALASAPGCANGPRRAAMHGRPWDEPVRALATAANAKAPPARSRSVKTTASKLELPKGSLKARLSGARRPSAVVELVQGADESNLQAGEVATALHRFARVCTPKEQRRQDVQDIWARLTTRLSALGPEVFGLRDALDVLYAHAKFEMKVKKAHDTADALRELVKHAILPSVSDGATPVGRVTVFLWSLGKLMQRGGPNGRSVSPGPDALEPAVSRVLRECQMLDGRDLSQALWSLAQLRVPVEEEALKQVEQRIVALGETLTDQDASVLLWSLADIGLSRPPNNLVLTRLEKAVGANLANALPKGVSTTLWSFARFEHTPSAAVLELLDAYVADTESDDAAASDRVWVSQTVSNIWWAWSKLVHRPSAAALAAMEQRTAELLPSFNNQAVANTMYAWALMSRNRPDGTAYTPPTSLAKSAGQHAQEMIVEMTTQETANVLFAMDTLQLKPADRVMEHVVRRMGEFTDNEFYHVLHYFVRTGYDPGHSIVDRTTERMRSAIQSSKLAYLPFIFLKKLQVLGYSPGNDVVDEVSQYIVKYVHMYDARNLAHVLYTWNMLGYVPSTEMWVRYCTCVSSALVTQEWDPKLLTTLLWNFAMMSHWHEPEPELVEDVMATLMARIKRDASLENSQGEANSWLRQLYQAEQLLALIPDQPREKPLLVLPDALRARSLEVWKAPSRTLTSHMQVRVSRTLERAGFVVENEARVGEGFVCDILVRQGGATAMAHDMVVEVDGPSHYARALTGPVISNVTLTRRLWLHKLGVPALYVPYYAWPTFDVSAEDAYVAGVLAPRLSSFDSWSPAEEARLRVGA